MRYAAITLATSLTIAGTSMPAFAFHSGGVAECEGCHTMHNSSGGERMTTALPQYQSGPYLLKGSDAGSACLNCHQGAGDTGPNGYHVSTAEVDMPQGYPPLQLTPGGDFGWLKKTYNWIPRTGAPEEVSKGERHGHNIVAADYGYSPDGTILNAPGGETFQYPGNKLTCISCHDPHGRYRVNTVGTQSLTGKPIYSSGSYGALPTSWGAVGTYRLLAGAGYQPKSMSGNYAFSYGAFSAASPSTYNRSESAGDTRVAYGRSVSLWCANCHTQMHTTFGSYVHPADQTLGAEVAANYNAYKKSGDISGVQARAYLSLVPFQSNNTSDIATLANQRNSTDGPASSDRVMCLSCHRAHASGFDGMLRFGLGNEFITVADGTGTPVWPDPATNPAQAQGRTVAETRQAYYDRPATNFAPYQRVLCNKCHAKD